MNSISRFITLKINGTAYYANRQRVANSHEAVYSFFQNDTVKDAIVMCSVLNYFYLHYIILHVFKPLKTLK